MNLKRLALAFTLTCIVSGASVAGETPIAPCAPGQTDTPPCSQSVTYGSTDPGETSAPPASAVDLTTIAEAVALALSLF